MKRYNIWDKQTDIITPSGKTFTSAEWMAMNPAAYNENLHIVCSAGIINGGYFGILEAMVADMEATGVDFSGCDTPEAQLARIEEEFERIDKEQQEQISTQELTATSLASIAASLEYQNMLTLDDVEVE